MRALAPSTMLRMVPLPRKRVRKLARRAHSSSAQRGRGTAEGGGGGGRSHDLEEFIHDGSAARPVLNSP